MSAQTGGIPSISGMSSTEWTPTMAETPGWQQQQEAAERHTTAWMLKTEERPVTADTNIRRDINNGGNTRNNRISTTAGSQQQQMPTTAWY
jgi:hypothetical protein